MHPILFKIGPLTIYSYGAMVALGFGLATLLIYARAAKFGLDKDKIIDLVIIILVVGIIGARALYVFLNLPHYMANPMEVPNLSKGGLVWYGGFLSALFAAIWYIRKKRIDFWAVADLMAPYIALAQSFGRIGCFLNGCCYGIEVAPGSPFAVTFPCESISRQPTQIYSSIALFSIFVILMLWQERRHFYGEIFLCYCLLYSFKRFFMEFLRGDNPHLMLGLTLSQYISIAIFLASLLVFLYKVIKWKENPSGSK